MSLFPNNPQPNPPVCIISDHHALFRLLPYILQNLFIEFFMRFAVAILFITGNVYKSSGSNPAHLILCRMAFLWGKEDW